MRRDRMLSVNRARNVADSSSNGISTAAGTLCCCQPMDDEAERHAAAAIARSSTRPRTALAVKRPAALELLDELAQPVRRIPAIRAVAGEAGDGERAAADAHDLLDAVPGPGVVAAVGDPLLPEVHDRADRAERRPPAPAAERQHPDDRQLPLRLARPQGASDRGTGSASRSPSTVSDCALAMPRKNAGADRMVQAWRNGRRSVGSSAVGRLARRNGWYTCWQSYGPATDRGPSPSEEADAEDAAVPHGRGERDLRVALGDGAQHGSSARATRS